MTTAAEAHVGVGVSYHVMVVILNHYLEEIIALLKINVNVADDLHYCRVDLCEVSIRRLQLFVCDVVVAIVDRDNSIQWFLEISGNLHLRIASGRYSHLELKPTSVSSDDDSSTSVFLP